MHVFLVFKQKQFTFNYASIRLLFHFVLNIAEPIIIMWEELLYSLLTVWWAGHIAHMGESSGVWWGDLRERDHLKDPGVDERIILRWIFSKWYVGAWTGSIWFRIGTWWALVYVVMNLRVP
jgi:hypothetical protein